MFSFKSQIRVSITDLIFWSRIKAVSPEAKTTNDFGNNEDDFCEPEEENLEETKYQSIADFKGATSPRFEQAGFNATFKPVDKKKDVDHVPLKRVISEMPKHILSSDLNQFIEEPAGKKILFYII